MALIKCVECKTDISEKASACPNCGHPLSGRENTAYFFSYMQWGYQWQSKAKLAGWPLIHIAVGRDEKTGKLLVAKGIIAIGQFAIGLITIAQFGIGVIFGFGQFVTGVWAIGQFAFGINVIAQLGIGEHVLAQMGLGKHVWSVNCKDPQAIEYFQGIFKLLRGFFA
ncbi:MAG: hypothetical protein V1739_01685 [Candidatus Omnitrophota bacterium]